MLPCRGYLLNRVLAGKGPCKVWRNLCVDRGLCKASNARKSVYTKRAQTVHHPYTPCATFAFKQDKGRTGLVLTRRGVIVGCMEAEFVDQSLNLTISYGMLWTVALILAVLLVFGAFPKSAHHVAPLVRFQSAIGLGKINSGLFLLALMFWGMIFVALFIGLLTQVWDIVNISRASLDEEGGASVWRFALTKLTALTAVLGAIVAFPFTLVRLELNRRQTETNEQGMITDRINKAVEGLGAEKTVRRQRRRQNGKLAYAQSDGKPDLSKPIMEEVSAPNLEVRIGAIYALERIAQDSDRDHVQIMEILCAYIRENAPAKMAATYPEHWIKDPETGDPVEEPATPDMIRRWANSLDAPRTDIQTALTVIGRRAPRQIALEGRMVEGEWEGYRLDLRDTCLQNVDLSKARLNHANLSDARLQGANLWEARLQGASLRAARLQGADLRAAHLEKASMEMARLQGADLSAANMQGINLVAARLQRAICRAANLQEANLKAARLQNAVLQEAVLWRANLYNARLQNARLQRAMLQGASLVVAKLQNADLRGCQMFSSDLRESFISGTQFQSANMQGTDLSGALPNETTNFNGAKLRGAGLRYGQFSKTNFAQEQLAGMFVSSYAELPNHLVAPNFLDETGDNQASFYLEWRAWQKEIGFDPDGPLI